MAANEAASGKVDRLRDYAIIASFALGVTAVVGNVLHIDDLRNFTPWGTYIKMNPALCLSLLSAAIWLRSRRAIVPSVILATSALLVAVPTVVEWMFNISVGIDELFAKELTMRAQKYPGRMPLNAALCFVALAGSVLLSTRADKVPAQIAAAVSLGLSMLSVVGLAYGLTDLGMFGSTTLIAFPMAVALVFTSLGAFLLHPTEGLARLLSTDSLGGLLARCVLPISAVFPFIGALSGIGVSSRQDLILLALFNAVVLPIAIWLVAIKVDRLDAARKAAFDAAIKAKEEALAANAVKARFIATLSHEVRTPLAGVIGLNEILSLSDLEGESKEIAQMALNSSRQLMHVLNDLLDFQKLEAGKITIEQNEFTPASVIGDVVLVCRSECRDRPISVTSHLDEHIPQVVLGDRLRLSQILLNLSSNAAKFTESGTISIRADMISETEDDVRVRFSVQDTGIGISQTALGTLFQPFVQADSSISRRYGGTGLGLSICKQFAELMGGSIAVKSEPGKGSTFWCELPLGKVKSATVKKTADA